MYLYQYYFCLDQFRSNAKSHKISFEMVNNIDLIGRCVFQNYFHAVAINISTLFL